MFGGKWQLAIFYSPTGELVRSIKYHSQSQAIRCGGLAMKWLNPDRFHWQVLPEEKHIPDEYVGIPTVSAGDQHARPSE